MSQARVVKSDKRVFECRLNDGQIITATALGNLLKEDTIVVGDYVELEEQAQGHIIKSVQARKSEIFRMLRRESKKKSRPLIATY